MRILHFPIFLACRELAPSLFWKRLFEGLAYREPPKGVHFEGERVYSTIKKHEFGYEFGGKEPESIFKDLFTILSKVCDIQPKKQEVVNEESHLSEEDNWAKIRKKSFRENLIHDFILTMKKAYNLQGRELEKLHFYVTVGISFKMFLPNEIILKGGKIISILGIEFAQNEVIVKRKFKEPKFTLKKSHPGLWEKYVELCSKE